MLDNTRMRAELAPIHRALSSVAATPRGKQLADELRRATGAATPAVLWQSLFADCLRVIHCAVAADDQVSDDELEAVYEPLYSIARHYADVMPALYGAFDVMALEETHAFLDCYAGDAGPFGRGAAEHWPGLQLCRQAAELGESAALESYEQMMSWLITSACQIGGVTEADQRWHGRVDELHELRRALARCVVVESSDEDLRVKAFLEGTGVFAAVQPAWSIHDDNPFDVGVIHAEVREVFEDMVYAATEPNPNIDGSRMLLILGDSGAGKTHLLRGLRHSVHEQRRGFVVYAQLHSASDDYARYLLQHVVDSLARPYLGPTGGQTGLFELAYGLPKFAGEPLKAKIDRLIDDSWESTGTLAEYINDLVDGLLEHNELVGLNNDLLRVLLYALHPDPRTTSRVYRYLRCEHMTDHDCRWIGGVKPRLDRSEPLRMILDLARLMHITQQGSLVLMVDQAELAGHDASSGIAFKRAIDTLHSIVTNVPSTVAVLACLTDLYNSVRSELSKSMLDRLEMNPPQHSLRTNRSYPEILAIVGRRLAWLYDQASAVYRPETPVYPIPESELRNLVNWRTRDILDWCHQFQERCIKAREIIQGNDEYRVSASRPVDEELAKMAAEWNDAMHAPGIEIPDEDGEILDLLSQAAALCAEETGLTIEALKHKNDVLRVALSSPAGRTSLAIAVTNRGYQRGAFAGQVDALRRAARGAIPVAVRTVEFPRGEVSDHVIGQLIKGGGLTAHLDASTLRTLVAFRKFQAESPSPRLAEWQRRARPVSNLAVINQIFDLERLGAAPGVERTVSGAADTADTDAQVATRGGPAAAPTIKQSGTRSSKTRATAAASSGAVPPSQPTAAVVPSTESPAVAAPARAAPARTSARSLPKPAAPAAPPTLAPPPASSAAATAGSIDAAVLSVAPPGPAAILRVGTSTGFAAEPRTVELASLLRHVGVLGSSGSGKTTLALSLIEQALERDVAVVMVDRKGDLAGYARPDWWKQTADPERARRLAERLDVRLFTPGTRGGRPLSISVVPDLEHVPEHERDRMVGYAAHALAAMMRFGDSANDTARRAILTQAITILAERKRGGGLPELISLLEERDDALIGRAGRYDDRLFKRLVQDLETVRLSEADLFDPAAEALSAETLIGRKPDGKVPLAIASTRFLGEAERIQSWVAHLIASLSRHLARSPSAQLSTLFMIDEADLFMPAGAAKPPSKEPLQDLLKRARSAGLGVMLASQSPADFDYRSREQINSWFLGRIAEKRSIDKMKPLFEHRPAVGGKLGNLEAGRFVMLQDGGASDLERTPSLLRTEQLLESELMSLAAQSRERSSASAQQASREGASEVVRTTGRRPGRPRVRVDREQSPES